MWLPQVRLSTRTSIMVCALFVSPLPHLPALGGRGGESQFETELREQGWTVNRDASSHPAKTGDIVVVDTKTDKIVRVHEFGCVPDLVVGEAALGSFSASLEAEINANAGFLANVLGLGADVEVGRDIHFGSVAAVEAAKADLARSNWTAACRAWVDGQGSTGLSGSLGLRLVGGEITSVLQRESHTQVTAEVKATNGQAAVGTGGALDRSTERSSDGTSVTIAYLFESVDATGPTRKRAPESAGAIAFSDDHADLFRMIAGQAPVRAFTLRDGSRPSAAGARFSSSDPAVAVVDGDGIVTPKAPGYTVVRGSLHGETLELPVAVSRLAQDLDLNILDGQSAALTIGPGRYQVIINVKTTNGANFGVTVVLPPAPACSDLQSPITTDYGSSQTHTITCDLAQAAQVTVKNPTGLGWGPAEVGTLEVFERPPALSSWTGFSQAADRDTVRPFTGTWFVTQAGATWRVDVDPAGRGTVTKAEKDGTTTGSIRIGPVVDGGAYAAVESTTDPSRLLAAPVKLFGPDELGRLRWQRAWAQPMTLCSAATLAAGSDAVRATCGPVPADLEDQ